MRSLLARLAALGALAAMVSGCGTSNSPVPVSSVVNSGGGVAQTGYTQSAYLRVVNGNSSAGLAAGATVCLDQTTVAAGLPYGGTTALAVTSGAHVLSVYAGAAACAAAPNNAGAIYNVSFNAQTRYAIVIGGTSSVPTAYGFLDNVGTPLSGNGPTQPVLLFNDAAASIAGATPAPAPTPTGTPGPSQATLQYTPTGAAAPATVGSTATIGTGAKSGVTPPATISFTTVNAVPLNTTQQGAGTFSLLNPNAPGAPATVFTAKAGTGNTAPVTSVFALDNTAGTQNLVIVTTDPSFGQLGY